MQQNIFRTTRSNPRIKSPDFPARRFLSPTNLEPNKPAMLTEPDFTPNQEEYDKVSSLTKKAYVITEEDEYSRPMSIFEKSKSLSIAISPKMNMAKALNLASPLNSANIKMRSHFDPKTKTTIKPYQNDSISAFETLMKRLSRLQLNSTLPNPEPTKCSEKSYGIIKAFGICTNQGLFRNYNEDRVSILLNISRPAGKKADEPWPNCSIFSVFDGHGGTKCADFLRNNLHNYIIKSKHFPWNPQEALREAFELTENAFTEECLNNSPGSHEKSGSCALVLLLIEDVCYICNLGDSRAVISQGDGSSVYALTRDHKPSDKQEQRRIMNAGGRIYQNNANASGLPLALDPSNSLRQSAPHRILPGKLSVSRAFGDIEAKLPQFNGNPNVLVAKPEITKIKITSEDDFIILGCDGIFDKLSNEEASKACWDSLNRKTGTTIHDAYGIISEDLIKAALLSKSFDNVTAIVIGFSAGELLYNKSQIKMNLSKNYTKNILTSGSALRDGLLSLSTSSRHIASPINNLLGTSQRGIENVPEPDPIGMLKRRESQPVEYTGGLNLNKEEYPADAKLKSYLPHINKTIKQITSAQPNPK